MSDYVSLERAKQHLNIESGFTDDDELIGQYIDAAEQAVNVHCNEDFETLAENNGGELPAPLIQAMLLMIGNLYQNREIVGTKTQELPDNYKYLINLYINYNN